MTRHRAACAALVLTFCSILAEAQVGVPTFGLQQCALATPQAVPTQAGLFSAPRLTLGLCIVTAGCTWRRPEYW